MKISEQFAGSYFRAQDLPQPRVLTIQDCTAAKMPEGDTKPALRFVGEQQQLVLNKTNGFCIAEWFGDDTAAWSGRTVELYSTTTSFGGRMVPAIRVRLPPQQQQYQQPMAPQQQPMQYVVPSPQPQYRPAPVQQASVPTQKYAAPVQPQAPPQQWQVPEPSQPAPAADFFDGPVDA